VAIKKINLIYSLLDDTSSLLLPLLYTGSKVMLIPNLGKTLMICLNKISPGMKFSMYGVIELPRRHGNLPINPIFNQDVTPGEKWALFLVHPRCNHKI
jgi:hypothetical protein